MVCSPDMEPGVITYPVSNIDLTPTLCELANISIEEIAPWCEGESLVHLGQGGERTSPVAMEYAAEASYSPMVMEVLTTRPLIKSTDPTSTIWKWPGPGIRVTWATR